MAVTRANLEFTGEVWIPGKTPQRIEADHIARYNFAANFVRDKKVLDIACGVGGGSIILASAGARHVDSVDISPRYIKYAIKHHSHKKISYYISDINRFKRKSKYDLIICFETIEHVSDTRKTLLNLSTLLKNEGLLIISSPNRLVVSPKSSHISSKPQNKFHVKEFIVKELKLELQSVGFVVKRSNVYGQRFRPLIKNQFLKRYYNRFTKPDTNSSSQVQKIMFTSPRYIVLVASKP